MSTSWLVLGLPHFVPNSQILVVVTSASSPLCFDLGFASDNRRANVTLIRACICLFVIANGHIIDNDQLSEAKRKDTSYVSRT